MTLISRLRAVLLVLVLLPLLTVATTPRPASAQSTRYVQLVSLTCIETEDSIGADEPFVTVGGTTVWTGSLNDDQSVNLIGLPARPFNSQVTISLYDDDPWPDADDWLGTKTISSVEAGLGTLRLYFNENGALYQLNYYVY